MFVARKPELEWLERQSRINRLLFVTGVRGVGKSTLLASWVRQRERKFHWLTLDRLKDLSHSLGHPGKSLERALELAAAEWMNLDVVVWDEAHLLSASAQRSLFSFLQNSPFLPLQVFLSDEALAHDAAAAQLQVKPFGLEQVHEYLKAVFDREPTEEDVHQAVKLSGGVPLLLQIFARGGTIHENAKQQLLDALSSEERALLVKTSALGRTFSDEDIPQSERPALANLSKKFLVDKLPGGANTYLVPSYVRSLSLSAVDMRELKAVYVEISRKCEDPFEALFFALRGNAEVEKFSGDLPLERMEHMRRDDLEELSQLAGAWRRKSSTNRKLTGLARLELRSLWILGRRADAVAAAEELLGDYAEIPQDLALECAQIFNRAGKFEQARKFAESAARKSDPVHEVALRLEIGSSWISTDRSVARQILADALKFSQRLMLRADDEKQIRLTQAQCHFQLARCYDLENDYAAALQEYTRALAVFEQCERPYFAAVTLLNSAWIYLKEYRWQELKALRTRLNELSDRYGYTYVKAGLELIESIEARIGLEPGKALRKIEASLRRLGASAPLAARIDSQVELVRVLLALGMRKQAAVSYEHLKAMSREAPAFQKKRIKDLVYEVRNHELTQEELLEYWHEDKSEESLLRHLAERGIVSPKEAQNSRLSRFFALENALFAALEKQNETEIWRSLARMEAELAEVSDALMERVAVLLMQATLSKTAADKLSEAERELARLSTEPECIAPLQAWLSALKAERKQRPQDMDSWKKSALGDQERWARWLRTIFPQEEKPWALTTASGTEYAQAAPQNSAAPLFMLEHLGEVRWRGKAKKEFIRRHSLRRILCLLLESGIHGVSKHTIAATVWGETYNPEIHDTRTYTSIQRLRAIFADSGTIQSWQGGYRWNPEIDFLLVRPNQKQNTADTRCQSIILQTLSRYAKGVRPWVRRSELVEITQASEATVKRELTKLLSHAKIQRSGSGRSVVYSLQGSFGSNL